jgi:hypothetical protein
VLCNFEIDLKPIALLVFSLHVNLGFVHLLYMHALRIQLLLVCFICLLVVLCKWQEVFTNPTRVLCYGAQPPKRLMEITKCRIPASSGKRSARLSGQRSWRCTLMVYSLLEQKFTCPIRIGWNKPDASEDKPHKSYYSQHEITSNTVNRFF